MYSVEKLGVCKCKENFVYFCLECISPWQTFPVSTLIFAFCNFHLLSHGLYSFLITEENIGGEQTV
jgi:hypothetical protein